MAQETYTRQTSFDNGDVIDATLLNAEYDQLEAAFTSLTGHSHNGVAGEGGYIPLISDTVKSSYVTIDTSNPAEHNITFFIRGVEVMKYNEALGLTVNSLDYSVLQNAPILDTVNFTHNAESLQTFLDGLNVSDITDLNSTPVPLGFFRWNAGGTVADYVTTIDYSVLANAPVLDSINFTHNTENMDTFLEGLSASVIDVSAEAAQAIAAAAAADISAAEAEAAADRVEAAAGGGNTSSVIVQTGGGTLSMLKINELSDNGTYFLPLASSVAANLLILIDLPDKYKTAVPTISVSGGDTISYSGGTDTSIIMDAETSESITLASDGISDWRL